MERVKDRYVWDKREGSYFIEWWDGKRRCRQLAGQTPSQATEAQRRKRNELIGEHALGGRRLSLVQEEEPLTHIAAEPSSPFCRARLGIMLGPLQGQRNSDVRHAAVFEKGNEIQQANLRVVQFEPQTARIWI